MSILKYYKVDSDGKIKRLRRECPSAECGAGIFVRILPGIACDIEANEYHADGLPQGPPVLRQVRPDLHLPARLQAPRCLSDGGLADASIVSRFMYSLM